MKLRKRDLFLLVAAPALMLGAIGTVGTVSNNKASEVVAAGEKYTFSKITSTTDLTDGLYLIVCESEGKIFDGSRATLDAERNTQTVTVNEHSLIESAAGQWSQYAFTIASGANNKKYIRSASNKYIGRNSTKNGLDTSNSALDNTIAFDNNGNANITSGGLNLRYNKTSGQERFRYFTTTQQVIQLYKGTAQTSNEPSISLSADNASFYMGSTQEGDATDATITVTAENLGNASISWEITQGDDIVEVEGDNDVCYVAALSTASTGGAVKIKASATVGEQSVEETIDLTVIKKEQLTAPTNLSFNSADNKLTWDSVANATSYKVTVTTSGGAATAYTAAETTNTYLILENLVSGDYKFKVEAFGTDSSYVKYLSSSSAFESFSLTILFKSLIESITPVANLGFSYAGYEGVYTADYKGKSESINGIATGTNIASNIGIGDCFTVTVDKGSAGTGAGLNKDGTMRLYGKDGAGSMLIIEPTNGHKISTVTIKADNSSYSVGNNKDDTTSFLAATNGDNNTEKTFDVYSDACVIRNTASGTTQVHMTEIEIHTINVTSFDDVSMKFRASIPDETYNNIGSITAVGARLSVAGSEQHIDFAGTAENITAGTNEHHFTFRVDDIPSSAFETSMTIAPYITGNIDGKVQTVYLQEKTISVNGMIAKYDAMTDLPAQQKLLISAFKTHYGID